MSIWLDEFRKIFILRYINGNTIVVIVFCASKLGIFFEKLENSV